MSGRNHAGARGTIHRFSVYVVHDKVGTGAVMRQVWIAARNARLCVVKGFMQGRCNSRRRSLHESQMHKVQFILLGNG